MARLDVTCDTCQHKSTCDILSGFQRQLFFAGKAVAADRISTGLIQLLAENCDIFVAVGNQRYT